MPSSWTARTFHALVALFCLTSGLPAAEPPPVRAFVEPPAFRLPKLSPDGKTLAMIGVRDGKEFLALLDLASMKAESINTFTKMKLIDYWWKEGGQLLFRIREEDTGWSYFRSFDLKTKKVGELSKLGGRGIEMVNPLPQDPEQMIVSTWDYYGGEIDLRRLNLKTGESTVLEKNLGEIYRWLTDRNGQLVAGFGREDETWFMLVHSAPGTEWQRTNLGKKRLPDFWPIAVFSDQRRLLGYYYDTPNTASIVVWDPATGKHENVFQSPEVDPDDVIAWGEDVTRVRAIGYETDRPQFFYLEEKDRKLADSIDRVLPKTTNTIVSTSKDEAVIVIQAYSDTEPSSFYVLDRRTGRLLPLGSSYPSLPSASMTPSSYFVFPAPDGLQLHGRLYAPIEAKLPPPAIVIVGPELNGPRWYREFNLLIQVLASRGYAVARFDYRGAEGYGRTLAEAGDQQLSTGMPADITAGIKWLVGKGLIDQRRVAIMGFNQGGTVALETLAQHQELFAVWVNFNTPMVRGILNYNDVVFGRYDDAGRKSRLGGVRAAFKYFDSIVPADLLAQVHVPAFNYYVRNSSDNSTVWGGDQTDKYFSRRKLPYVFLQSPASHTSSDLWEDADRKSREEWERIYTQLLEFLDKNLRQKP